jgi:hypothetical protein
MGRLTLNILLSFGQFERVVTAERVCDKVAAFRRKGRWMGGVPPYGYRVENRKLLVVDEDAAEHVRWIFARFIEISSCTMLSGEVGALGFGAPRGNRNDKEYLYQMLLKRSYTCDVVQKAKSYPGERDAIIDRALCDKVHVILKEGPRARGHRTRA